MTFENKSRKMFVGMTSSSKQTNIRKFGAKLKKVLNQTKAIPFLCVCYFFMLHWFKKSQLGGSVRQTTFRN